MDPFAAAYISGAATLIVAELWAIFRRNGGDTITEKLKATPITHAAMASLVIWASYHFTAEDWIKPYDHPVTDVSVASLGALAGYATYRRNQRDHQ